MESLAKQHQGVQITLKTLTPIWTGGVETGKMDRLHETASSAPCAGGTKPLCVGWGVEPVIHQSIPVSMTQENRTMTYAMCVNFLGQLVGDDGSNWLSKMLPYQIPTRRYPILWKQIAYTKKLIRRKK